MAEPLMYWVLSIPHVVDGDTLWAQRLRRVAAMQGMRRQAEVRIGESEGMELIATPRPGGIGMDLMARDYAGGRKVRLHDGLKGLNTPEKKDDPEGWAAATRDLEAFIATGPTELHSFGVDSFGRLLADLRRPNWDSAVQYMVARGWRSYK